jgi:hypothetical protein
MTDKPDRSSVLLKRKVTVLMEALTVDMHEYMGIVHADPGSKRRDALPSLRRGAPYSRPQSATMLVMFAKSFPPAPAQVKPV